MNLKRITKETANRKTVIYISINIIETKKITTQKELLLFSEKIIK